MKTQITFVLDSSGSMSKIRDDTVGGFNMFLQEQREEEGTATVTLYDFNTTVECRYQARLIEEAPKLDATNYQPGGKTALHDAIATAVQETDARIDTLSDSARPDHVIVVVLTDGKENASETPADTVRELVETQREEHDWEFLFIGANQDAALTAQDMGMAADHSLNMDHSGDGTRAAYESTSKNISQARREGRTGGYDDEDRKRQNTDTDS
jgi:Mg-chelatase subunit ChlD